jgi:hypothetical protein
METNRAKEIIVSVLQTALTGHLDPSSNFSPQDVADAISVKVDFEKTHGDSRCDNIIGTILDRILKYRDEMKAELETLSEDDKLLMNFIRGKLTAYEEILDVLKTL